MEQEKAQKTPGRSKLRAAKIVLIILAAIFILSFVYQMATLIGKFLAFPTDVVITEQQGEELQLYVPAVTVCNLNPTTARASVYHAKGIPTLKQHADTVESLTTCGSGCTEEERLAKKRLRARLMTFRGYRQRLTSDEQARLVGHEQNTLIRDCQALVTSGMTTKSIPCEEKFFIGQITHYSYFNCYTISPKNDTLAGLSLTLYLDNFQSDLPYVNSFSSDERITGAIVVFHDNRIHPVLETGSIVVPPGTEVGVDYKIDRRFRSSIPYGDCEDLPTYGDPMSVGYSQERCVSACLEDRVAKDCKCRSAELYGVRAHKYSTLPFCHSTQDGWDTLLKRDQCATEATNRESDGCECVLPCMQTTYRLRVHTTAPFPEAHAATDVYNRLLRNEHYGSRFLKGSTVQRQVVANNVAKFKMVPAGNVYVRMEENPAFFLGEMLFRLGSAMTIWGALCLVLWLIYRALKCRLTGSKVGKSQCAPYPAARPPDATTFKG